MLTCDLATAFDYACVSILLSDLFLVLSSLILNPPRRATTPPDYLFAGLYSILLLLFFFPAAFLPCNIFVVPLVYASARFRFHPKPWIKKREKEYGSQTSDASPTSSPLALWVETVCNQYVDYWAIRSSARSFARSRAHWFMSMKWMRRFHIISTHSANLPWILIILPRQRW